MRILFVIPPYRTTDALVAQLYPMPLAAASMAAVLRQAGHEVVIKDFLIPAQKSKCARPDSFEGRRAPPYMHYGQPLGQCRAWLRRYVDAFDAVGLCMGQCNVYETGTLLAPALRRRPLVIGGPFVTTATEQAMELTGAPVAVVGEGEAVCEEAFAKAAAGGTGVVQGVPMAAGDLPLPAWDIAPPGDYPRYKGRVRGVLTVSRGCPHACSFCSVHTIMGRRHTRCSADRIYQHLARLWQLGVKYFCFLDDNLFMSEGATDEVLTAVERLRRFHKGGNRTKFYVEEGIEVRVAAIPGLLHRIHAAGFDNIGLGLETLSERALKANKKPYRAAELEAAVEACREASIPARAFYIVGFLSDTLQSVAGDLVAFGKLGLAARPNNLKLYPGTETTAAFKKAGLVDDEYDWRCSSFWTPDRAGLPFVQIRKLKTILGAVGFAAEEFGVRIFADPPKTIQRKLGEHGYRCTWGTSGEVCLRGNMFRPTPYRHLAMLMLLAAGFPGAEAKVVESGVIEARACEMPADDVQAALVKALGRA